MKFPKYDLGLGEGVEGGSSKFLPHVFGSPTKQFLYGPRPQDGILHQHWNYPHQDWHQLAKRCTNAAYQHRQLSTAGHQHCIPAWYCRELVAEAAGLYPFLGLAC